MDQENKQNKIALTLIVKDDSEADVFERCLQSARHHFDGLYVTGTNKPDTKIKEITKKYRGEYSFFKWTKDFSEARNYNLAQVPKSFNYFFWLDADDVLTKGEKIEELVEQAAVYNISAVFLPYLYQVDLDEKGKVREIVIEHTRERIVKNDGTFKWVGPLHETLIEQRQENVTKVSFDEPKIVHLSTNERIETNLDRNIEILEATAEKQQHRDPRTLIYLAKAYFDKGKFLDVANRKKYFDLARALFNEYIHGSGEIWKDYREASGWREERATAWSYIADMARLENHLHTSVEAVMQAISEAPEFPNYYLDLSMSYCLLQEWDKAQHWLNVAVAKPIPKTTIIVNRRDLKSRALEIDIQIALAKNELDRAFQSSSDLIKVLPDIPAIMKRHEEIALMRDTNKVAQSLVYVGRFLDESGEANKIVPLLNAVPKSIEQEPFIAQMRSKFMPAKIWGKDEITILCGPGFEQWSPMSLNRNGMGGSEEAVVRISNELTDLGYKVTVYGNPGAEYGNHNGVEYKHYYQLNNKDTFNILIYWRGIGMVDFGLNARQSYLWLHDVPNSPDFIPERTNKLDRIFVLSEFHKEILKFHTENDEYIDAPDDKVFVTANGLTIESLPVVARDPHKIVWTSSYDRGLVYLLKMWPEIKKAVPEATLDICYGWDLFNVAHKDNPAKMLWKQKVSEMMDQEGITHHGRLGHAQVAELTLKSGVWAYPTMFEEISCHPAGTRISTDQGEKEIQNINIDDYVLTHRGGVKAINKIMKRWHHGNMISVKTQSGDDLELTPEHPLYIIKGKSAWKSFDDIKNIEPVWVKAEDLKENDCLLLPKPNYLKAIEQSEWIIPKLNRNNNLPTEENEILDSVIVDEEMSQWIGYFVGDGSASPRTGKVQVLVANNHPEHTDVAISGFKKLGLTVKSRQLNGCVEYYVHSYRLARFLKDKLYINGLKVLPTVAMNQYGLKGLMMADGHVNDRTSNFTNKSLYLIGQVRQLLSLQGLTGKVQKRNHKNGAVSYSIAWTTVPTIKFYGENENYILHRVKSITTQPYEGWVYNLEVEGDNSYVSNGHAVHNCISAMKAQAFGAVPVVTNYAALKETVQYGDKVDVDITSEKGQQEYAKHLIAMLQDVEKQKKIRPEMMSWARETYSWETVARQWKDWFIKDRDEHTISLA